MATKEVTVRMIMAGDEARFEVSGGENDLLHRVVTKALINLMNDIEKWGELTDAGSSGNN